MQFDAQTNFCQQFLDGEKNKDFSIFGMDYNHIFDGQVFIEQSRVYNWFLIVGIKDVRLVKQLKISLKTSIFLSFWIIVQNNFMILYKEFQCKMKQKSFNGLLFNS